MHAHIKHLVVYLLRLSASCFNITHNCMMVQGARRGEHSFSHAVDISSPCDRFLRDQ